MKRHLGLVGLIVLLLGGMAAPAQAHRDPVPFKQGVASGEVRSTSVILWTRDTNGSVRVQVSTKANFKTLVESKKVGAPKSDDRTVSTEITGLKPNTHYFYRFLDLETGKFSRRGEFVTAPRANANVDVHFAYSGDSDGWFDPDTGEPAFNDFEVLDSVRQQATQFGAQFFIYLGDTIYSDSSLSPFGPADTVGEYRKAYKQNRSYHALRDMMATMSTYAVWDDHEVRNDFDSTVDPDLFAAGMRAFEEYMPVPDWDSELGFYRNFKWGKNVEFFVVDGRSFRSQEVDTTGACDNPPGSGVADIAPLLPPDLRMAFAAVAPQLAMPVPPACVAALNDPDRTLLGAAQKARLMDDLQDSTAKFKLIVNDVPVQNLYVLPYDRWEGYLAERMEILSFIMDNDIQNVVWLTTDTHANITNDVFTDFFTGVDTGTDEVVVGPIATNTFANEILQVGFPPEAVNTFALFVGLILGAECVNLDAYSYGNVIYTAATKQLSVQSMDDEGVGMCPPLIVG
jgi:phosphodiesterase/alkaline phosphatase D-like protein